MVDIKCKHYDNYKGKNFNYELLEEQSLLICEWCNQILMERITKQLVRKVLQNEQK